MATAQLTVTYVTTTGTAAENSVALQSALDNSGRVVLDTGGVFEVNQVLSIGSNTDFIIEKNTTLKAADGHDSSVLVTKSYLATPKTVTSCTSVGRLCTVVCPSHGFTQGQWVSMQWMVPEYYAGVYQVHEVLDASTFTYYCYKKPTATSASAYSTATFTGRVMSVRAADVDISVDARGVIDYNTNNTGSTAIGNMLCVFAHTAFMQVRGNYVNAAKYCIFVASAYGFSYRDLYTEGPSDGIHFLGPVLNARGSGYTGRNDDNQLAVGTIDYDTYMISSGFIDAVNCVDTYVLNSSFQPVRLWGDDNFKISAVIDGVHGDLIPENVSVVGMLDDAGAPSHLRDIVLRKIRVNPANGVQQVSYAAANCESLTIEDCGRDDVETSGGEIARFTAGVVGTLRLINNRMDYAASSKLVEFADTFGGVGTVVMIGNDVGTNWAISNAAPHDMKVIASGNKFATVAVAFRQIAEAGNMSIVGSGNVFTASNAARPMAAGTITVQDFSMPVDVQYVTPTTGQFCWNTNSSEAGGVGLVKSNGTEWVAV